MSSYPIQVKRLRPSAILPAYATAGAAGMDLHADLDAPLTLWGGSSLIIPTGIAIALPPYLEAQVRSRSGLAAKNGVHVLNSPGTIDSDYRGEIKVILHCALQHQSLTINPGDRIAQLVIAPVMKALWKEVEDLGETDRGTDGFGSTGVTSGITKSN